VANVASAAPTGRNLDADVQRLTTAALAGRTPADVPEAQRKAHQQYMLENGYYRNRDGSPIDHTRLSQAERDRILDGRFGPQTAAAARLMRDAITAQVIANGGSAADPQHTDGRIGPKIRRVLGAPSGAPRGPQ